MELLRTFGQNAIQDIIPLDRDSCLELVNYALTLPPAEMELHFLGILGESEISANFITSFMKMRSDLQKEKVKPKQKILLEPEKKKNPKTAWKEPSSSTTKSSTKSTTTSELLDKKPKKEVPSAPKKKTLSSLKDIESALIDLDLNSSSLRFCNCMATKHPLFEVAPNCLNCGKIICIKEGLQPCSFCGYEILSVQDRLDMKHILQKEKEALKELPLKPRHKTKRITVSTTTPGSFWDNQTKAIEKIEKERKALEDKEAKEAEKIDADLAQAQERLDTLLSYQANGTERTKIIDRASDFEITQNNIWLSPLERALQLKKQQKQLRKYEDQKAQRSGRGTKVVEMVIKDGKATMVENNRYAKNEEDDKENNDMKSLESSIKLKQEINPNLAVWDYENDQKKWEKPIYMNSGKKPSANSVDLKSRIQFNTGGDNVDLVANMPV